MEVVLNQKVNDRRSKSFNNFKKNSTQDISNVKFFSFTPISNDNNNGSETISPFTGKNGVYSKDMDSLVVAKAKFDKEMKELKDQIYSLEPIHEIPEKKVLDLLDSAGTCNFSENDLQDILLNLTVASSTAANSIRTEKSKDSKKSTGSGIKISPFNSKLKEYWLNFIVIIANNLEKFEQIIYQRFWFSILYLNFWFPKLAGFVSEKIGREEINLRELGKSRSITRSYFIPDKLKQLKKLAKLNFLRLQIRFKRNPYSTLFYTVLFIGTLLPLNILLLTIFTMATIYFFMYLGFFIGVGLVSSILIVPLLSTSFIFAVGVVVFGFFSNITFKSGQFIYFRTDKRLKFLLDKMTINTKKIEPIDTGNQATYNKSNEAVLPLLSED